MSWKVVDSANAEIPRRDEPWCTERMKAHWTEKILPRYETSHGALMPILHDVQHEYRHVPYQAMIEIASFLAIPPAEVLDTVSFYEEYTTEPVGKCVIGICQSIACEVCGHTALLDQGPGAIQPVAVRIRVARRRCRLHRSGRLRRRRGDLLGALRRVGDRRRLGDLHALRRRR